MSYDPTLHTEGSSLITTCLLLLVFCGLSGATKTAQAQARAYVTSHDNNSVIVVDTGTNTVIATVPISPTAFGLAVTPDGTRAYLSDTASNTVSVINTVTYNIIATIPVGATPSGVVIAPDGTRAYVSNIGSNTVSVIDTLTNSIVATIPVGATPSTPVITPDGTRLYVTSRDSDSIAIIDTNTNTVVDNIIGLSGRIDITPDGTRLYVTTITNDPFFGSTLVTVIDRATNAVVSTIPLNLESFGVIFKPDSSRAYVINRFEALNVIDTATNTVIAVIPLGDFPPGQFSGPGFIIAPAPQAPRSKDDCKNGNYLKFDPPGGRFANQGQCIKAFEARRQQRN